MKRVISLFLVLGWLTLAAKPVQSGVRPQPIAEFKQSLAFQDNILVAVANKTVISGMNRDEVIKSLGQPQKISLISAGTGKDESWIYPESREQPVNDYVQDPSGQLNLKTYYVRVIVGQITIRFQNGLVTSFSQNRTLGNTPTIDTPAPLTTPFALAANK